VNERCAGLSGSKSLKKYKQGYMIETALNGFCRLRGQVVGDVFCQGLGIIKKEKKWGQLEGFISRRKLYWDLVKNTCIFIC